jgi:pimeloyl-ACP methyl ester carboxylesterase
MNRSLWLIGLLCLLLLAACGDPEEERPLFDDEPAAAPAGPADNRPVESGATAEESDCPFDEPAGYAIRCGYLMVPENRSRPDSPTIELAYAIVEAAVDEGRPPIIYLAGGPGGSGIDDFVADPEGWQYPFTETRDLILLDQRGTGYSWPTLDCPEMAEEMDLFDTRPEESCHERLLDEGIDLAAYNTAENAADVADLRAALGIDSWDLLGISYGTRLALNVMRDYPAGVRSAVLDSVFPPNADTPGDEALAPLWSLERLFADCAADAFCQEYYPGLEAVFLEAVAALNDSPVDGVTGDGFFSSVTSALNDTSLIPLVPYVIYAVYDGDMAALDEIAPDGGGSARPRFQDGEDRSDSEGMYNSVICRDEYVFNDYETVEAAVVGSVPVELEAALLEPVADLFRVCSFWQAGAAGAIENDPVFSDIPTLILAGQYDLATPADWAYLAAETLANAFVFEFPGAGHSLLSGVSCAVDITAQFLDQPDAAPDAGCIDEIEWPYFE